MTVYEDRLEQHPVQQRIRQLEERLEEFPEDIPAGHVTRLERARRIVQLLRTALDSADAELVPAPVLSELDTHLQNAESHLQAYYGDASEAHITNADGPVDQALRVILAALTPLNPDVEFTSAREQARSYRASAAQFLRGIREETDELRTAIDGLRERINECQTKTDEAVQATRAKLGELEATIDEQKGRLDQAIQANQSQAQELQKQFSEAQERRIEQFRGFLDERQAEAGAQLEEVTTEAKRKLNEELSAAEQLVKHVQRKKEEVEELAGAVGASAMAGHHKQYADTEDARADNWRLVTSVAAVIVAALTAWAFAQEGDIEIASFWVKIGVAVPMAAFATYAGAESNKHRRNAARARDRQLNLLAVGPFLAELDKDAADAIRSVVALHMFAGEQEDDEHSGDDTHPPTGAGLAKQAVQKIIDLATREKP